VKPVYDKNGFIKIKKTYKT
jgi:hypothetical protein